MTSKNILSIVLSISFIWANAQGNLWQEMPNGEDFFDMRCIYQDSSTGILYVGSPRKIIGGVTVNCITYWNGTMWAAMDNGVGNGNFVETIINYHDTIYAGGNFWANSGAPGTGIMKWNGTTWEEVGYGQCEGTKNSLGWGGSVLSLSEIDQSMYVLGVYDTIGCLLGNGISTWNGAAWNTVQNFPNTYNQCCPLIISACMFNNQLYVTGQFYSVDSSSGNEIAYYDGSEWKTVGGGLHGSLTVPFDMVVYKGRVYIAGRFTKADGNPGSNIASWDGALWSDVGGGTNNQIRDLLVYHDKLYAFGDFTTAGGIPATKMASWDGSRWCGIASNFIMNGISCAGIYNDTLLAGGGFIIVQGNDTIRNFAKFLGGDYVDSCSASVGISELNQTNFDFSISPNPATDEFIVSTSENGLLTITNEVGQVIRSFAVHERQLKSLSSKFPAGNYFLTFQTDKNIQTKKLLIQH